MAIERVLIVGAGGREHALAWRIARDPGTPRVWVAPGNDGMAGVASRVDVAESDAPGLIAAARERDVDLVVIGPEAPLAAGVADELRAAGLRVFGPSRAAARLESSKWFAKELMEAAGIPTARAESFTDVETAIAALDRWGPPWVIKADGLAAGKGVRVTRDRDEAGAFLAECLSGARFGASGSRVLLEEFLEGEEASLMAVCDGREAVFLPAARDFKRARDGDQGPNTGGMGAFAPVAAVSGAVAEEVRQRVILPLLAAMERNGAPFRGLLYVGLMLGRGGFRVVEFNVRFGDPETEAVMPLIGGSLSRLLAGAADGVVDRSAIETREGAAVAVALVDEGYPEAVVGQGAIEGLDALEAREGIHVFHGGTRREAGTWRVRGGRAVFVTAEGRTPTEAGGRAYAAIDTLGGRGWRCRRDIAAPAGPTIPEEARSGWHAR